MFNERTALIAELGVFIGVLIFDEGNQYTKAAIEIFIERITDYFNEEEMELLDDTIHKTIKRKRRQFSRKGEG